MPKLGELVDTGFDKWIRETKNTTLFTVADIVSLPLSSIDSPYRFRVAFLYCFWLCLGSDLGVRVFKSDFGRLHSMWIITGHPWRLNKQFFDSALTQFLFDIPFLLSKWNIVFCLWKLRFMSKKISKSTHRNSNHTAWKLSKSWATFIWRCFPSDQYC